MCEIYEVPLLEEMTSVPAMQKEMDATPCGGKRNSNNKHSISCNIRRI